MWKQIFLGFAACLALTSGQRLLDIHAKTDHDVAMIQEMTNIFNLDVWRHQRTTDDSFQVLVPNEHYNAVMGNLKLTQAMVKTAIEDVQQLIDEQRTSMQLRSTGRSSDFNFETYNNFDEIEEYLMKLPEGTNQAKVKLSSIGQTFENRQIYLVHISDVSSDAVEDIFMDCGIHAREWISPAFCLYVIDQLVNHGENEPMLKRYNWHIVPVLNPDGYNYSHSDYRLWRKNRRDNDNSNCKGVDLNRNFGYNFDPNNGGSRNPCSDVYAGSGNFSENESKAVEDYILGNTFSAYLTIHSYGQMWLYPWGYTTRYPTDWKELDNVAKTAVDNLRMVNGEEYVYGTAARVIYMSAGGSDDWALGDAKIRYSYTLELRDTGAYGFLLPEVLITPTCIETWAAITAMANKMIPMGP